MGELHKLPQKQDCCGCSAFEQACSVLSPYEVCTPQKLLRVSSFVMTCSYKVVRAASSRCWLKRFVPPAR